MALQPPEVDGPMRSGDEKKDLLEHARFVHTTILAACLTLLIVLAGDSPGQLEIASREALRLRDVVQRLPDPLSLLSLGRPDWADCLLDPKTSETLACISESGLQAVSEPPDPLSEALFRRYDTDMFAFHRPPRIPHQLSPGFSISDAESLWTTLSQPVTPLFWVIADYWVIKCRTEEPSACGVVGFMTTSRRTVQETPKPRYSHAQILTPAQVTQLVPAKALAEMPPARGGSYTGWLVADDPVSRERLIVPLSQYKAPPLAAGRLFLLSPKCPPWLQDSGWQSFDSHFSTLASWEPSFKSLSLVSASRVLDSVSSRFSDHEVKLLGLELRVKNVALLGELILWALLTYFALHLLELAKRPGTDTAVAWIGVYDGRPAKLVTLLSLVAPAAVAIYIAIRSPGVGSWVLWLSASGAAITAIAATIIWLYKVQPRRQ